MEPINYLLPGRIVKYRNGNLAMYIESYYTLGSVFISMEGYMPLHYYDNNLWNIVTSNSKIESSYDIMSIYEVPIGEGLRRQLDPKYSELKQIWKREESLELTLEDIAKKFNVKSVKIVDIYAKEKVQINLFDRKRQKNNFRIIAAITDIARKYPELRFQQLLYNYGIIEEGVDKYYEEPEITLEKLESKIDFRRR